MKSNCFSQAFIGAIKCKGHLYKVIPKKDERGTPHFVWSEGNKYKHFTFAKKNKKRMKYWYNFIRYNGVIEDFPLEFLKNVKLRKIF